MLLRAVVAVLVCSTCHAAYPASYPYENEVSPPVDIRPSTPSETFDETDPGGFIYLYVAKLEIDETDLPFCHSMGGQFRWMLNSYGYPLDLPAMVFNCTAQGDHKTAQDLFTGAIDDMKICESGDCCTKYMGLPVAPYDQDKVTSLHKQFDNDFSMGQCTEVFPEEAYCVYVGGGFHWNCLEQIKSPDERGAIIACHDTAYDFILSCPVYATIGFANEEVESPLYIQGCSVEEQVSFSIAFEFCDKICHPKSYYNPVATSQSTSSGSSGSSVSPESSGAVHFLGMLFMFF